MIVIIGVCIVIAVGIWGYIDMCKQIKKMVDKLDH